MRNNTGMVAVLMGTIGVFLAILGLAVAVPTADASSQSPWYCYRLAPKFITSAATPCTFPCLLISPNVHPHIVVQPELDETPCHVAPSLHHKSQVAPSLLHETEVGRCRRGVCTVKQRPPVLKRKKRFICLVTLAALIKARKERKKLKEQMNNLRRLAWYQSMGGVHRAAGTGVGDTLYPPTRARVPGSAVGNAAVTPEIEIHIMPDGGNGGIAAGNSGRRISPTFISGSRVGGTIGNSNTPGGQPATPVVVTNGGGRPSDRYSNVVNEGIGAPDMPEATAGSSMGGRIGIAGAGVTGGGVDASLGAGGGNFDFRNGGMGGSLGRDYGPTAGIIGPGITGNGGRSMNGGGNARASISTVAATATRSTERGSGSATVVGIVGTRRSARGRGVGGNGRSGGLLNDGGEMTSGSLVGVGGVFATGGTRNPNDISAHAGAIGATVSGSRSGAPGLDGVSSAFSGAAGSLTRRIMGGSSARSGETGFVSGNGVGAGIGRNRYFPPDEEDDGSLDFDDAEEGERRSTINTSFRG